MLSEAEIADLSADEAEESISCDEINESCEISETESDLWSYMYFFSIMPIIIYLIQKNYYIILNCIKHIIFIFPT